MIDVLVKLASGEIKNRTVIKFTDEFDKIVSYEYNKDLDGFYDVFKYDLGDDFDIKPEFLNTSVELITPKEKEYLIKLNISGLRETSSYLNYSEINDDLYLCDNKNCFHDKVRFTKQEMQSIQPVKEFLEDAEDKVELIEVE